MNKILLVGAGGREDAIGRKLVEGGTQLYCAAKNLNPSLKKISKEYKVVNELDYQSIIQFAKDMGVDLLFVGPDPVLDTPLVDTAEESGISVASPSRQAARIETSKEYMREFIGRNGIQGNIFSKIFRGKPEVAEFMRSDDREFAVKPIGLTGGKGVKVMGLQLDSRSSAIAYAQEVVEKDGKVLLEERISGEEFSLQLFSDGKHVSSMPLAQDYKRAYENDVGPNTGGMGSITDADHNLPFISPGCRDEALIIMRKIAEGMRREGTPFRGIMYGQFMQVGSEPKIVEINARFADPEGINVLTLLRDDLSDILFRIAGSNLRSNIDFECKASTLKYIVPIGYGSNPQKGTLQINLSGLPENLSIYYAAVSGTMERVEMSNSRALAVIAKGDTIEEASDLVESNLFRVNGNYYVRHDIGSRKFMKEKAKSVVH
ncbi:MAG: phosphoribosylamine--glycine ligase [Thermoplasmataceae archaeon]